MARFVDSLARSSGEIRPSPSPGHRFDVSSDVPDGPLWLAICLPDLAFQAVDPTLPAEALSQPSVVVDSLQGRLCVVAVNDAARTLGIKPGFNLDAAYAFSGSIRVLERSPRAERVRLEALAAACFALTPTVSLAPPSSLLLEVRASLKLFGGLPSIKKALAESVRERGFAFHSCAAPTPLGALWLARHGSADALSKQTLLSRLSSLPLIVTCWPGSTLALLKDMGVETVGDCMRLSRGGFARRAGKQYLEDLDKASGRQPDLRIGFAPPERLSFRIELFDASTNVPVFVDAVTRMTEHLASELRMRQAQVRKMRLIFHHLRQAPTVYRLELLEASSEKPRFLDLLCDRIERVSLPAPATALGLEAGPLEPVEVHARQLFKGDPGAADEGSAIRLVERLRGRLGSEAVYGLALAPEHRPERACVKLVAKLRDKRAQPVSVSPWAHDRPLWILPAPEKLLCTGSTPCFGGPLKLRSGSERIESGWWDEKGISRDYFAATGTHGEKLWIYRDRSERDWYLHGIFG